MNFFFNILVIINLFFSLSYLFLNDEIIIAFSLFMVFFYLLIILRKLVLHLFFLISDLIYLKFYILLFLNKKLNVFFKNYIETIVTELYSINIFSFLSIIYQFYLKKLLNINFFFNFFRIKNIFSSFFNIFSLISSKKSFTEKIVKVKGQSIMSWNFDYDTMDFNYKSTYEIKDNEVVTLGKVGSEITEILVTDKDGKYGYFEDQDKIFWFFSDSDLPNITISKNNNLNWSYAAYCSFYNILWKNFKN